MTIQEEQRLVELRQSGTSYSEMARELHFHVTWVRQCVHRLCPHLALAPRGRVSDRPRQAAELRDQGWTFARIASRLAYTDARSAHRAVKAYRDRQVRSC